LILDSPFSRMGGGSFALHYKGLSIKSLIVQGQALFYHLFNQSVYGLVFHYNIIISIIFLITGLFLIISWKKKYFFIIFLFLAYFFIYGFFYIFLIIMFDANIQGHNQLNAGYIRRTLMFHLPYSIIAGYGIYLLNPIKKRKFLFLGFLPLLLLLFFADSFFISEFSESYVFQSYRKEIPELNRSFYFPRSLFKDVRATSPYAWDNDYFLALDKIPNDCLVITSRNSIVINDYFKNNHRKTASTALIFDRTKDLFLDEFRKNDCLIYIEDYQGCNQNHRDDDDYACQFLKEYLNKTFLFQEGRIEVYKAELKK